MFVTKKKPRTRRGSVMLAKGTMSAVPIRRVASPGGGVHQNEKTPREAGPVIIRTWARRSTECPHRCYRGLPASSMASGVSGYTIAGAEATRNWVAVTNSSIASSFSFPSPIPLTPQGCRALWTSPQHLDQFLLRLPEQVDRKASDLGDALQNSFVVTPSRPAIARTLPPLALCTSCLPPADQRRSIIVVVEGERNAREGAGALHKLRYPDAHSSSQTSPYDEVNARTCNAKPSRVVAS
jgi:hypothetical protein